MKNRFAKWIGVAAALSVQITSMGMPLHVRAAETGIAEAAEAVGYTYSGTCGPLLNYQMTQDGILTITGSGRMTSHPWTGSGIVQVILPKGLKSICTEAFLNAIKWEEDVVIPDEVEEIGNDAFKGAAIKSLQLSNKLRTIGDYAFYACQKMTGTLTIPASVEEIGAGAFSGDSTRQGCVNLTGLVFEDGSKLKKIYKSTFRGSGITGKVVLPDNLEEIYSYAFKDCAKLTELYIPASVTKIINDAFDDTGIKKITYGGSEEMWKEQGFSSVTGFANASVTYEMKESADVTVAFESNCGVAVPSQTVKYNSFITEPNLDRIGYTLDGWYKDADFTEKFDFQNETVKKSMTLYAKWEKMPSLTVRFVTNARNITVPSQEVEYGGKAEKPTDPKVDGYVFAGWFTDDDTFNNPYDFDKAVTESFTLYGSWRQDTSSGGGSGNDEGSNDGNSGSGNDGGSSNSGSSVSSASIYAKAANTHVVGEKVDIKSLYFISYNAARYVVSDKKIASIDKKGVLKAKKPGTIVVRALSGPNEDAYTLASRTITILEKPKLKFTSKYSASADLNKTLDAYAFFTTPSTRETAADSWTSSKPSVAEVNSETGRITIKSKGKATITAHFGTVKVKSKIKVTK